MDLLLPLNHLDEMQLRCTDMQSGPNWIWPYRSLSIFLQPEMDTDQTHLQTLKRLVCEATGCEALTPGDFYSIMAFVEGRTHEVIGLTTIKRLWQYGGMQSSPRRATLNVLARAIGYRNYGDFCEHYADTDSASDPVLGEGVKVSDLGLGDHMELRWNPGRDIVVEYLGNSTFRVLHSEASKLAVGDTFQAAFFAVGHPAMLANVIHGESSWPLYEIGQHGGLTLVRRI